LIFNRLTISLFSVAPRCPTCQQPVSKDKIVNDKSLQKEIQNLEVYCTTKDKGCDWDGTLRDFQGHIETCGFIPIDCPNQCGAKFERRFLNKHQNEDCAKRTVVCEFCMKINFIRYYSIYFSIKVKQIWYSKMRFLI